MNTIDCTLLPVSLNKDYEASILTKLVVFGISTPDEEKVTYKGQEYYCVPARSHFTKDSLAALDLEEGISPDIKNAIKTQYLKICSFAFLFNIGNNCVRDKYNRLIPIDLSSQEQHSILVNNDGICLPHLVDEVADKVFESLGKLREYDIITRDQNYNIMDKFQKQLDLDNLIGELPEVGTCCCCEGPCNPCSQTCGSCPRNGYLMAMGLGLI